MEIKFKYKQMKRKTWQPKALDLVTSSVKKEMYGMQAWLKEEEEHQRKSLLFPLKQTQKEEPQS